MPGRFFLLILLIPVLDLYLLVLGHRLLAAQWGGSIAWTLTLGFLLAAAMLGVSLGKRQGLAFLTRSQEQLRRGVMPSDTMLEGLLMLIGALALIVPGYLTDIIGLLLLVPWTRALFARRLQRWLADQARRGTIVMQHMSYERAARPSSSSADIIDVEVSDRSLSEGKPP